MIQRHNAIRDWLAAWIARLTGRPTETEEYVVAWNRPAADEAGQPVWEKGAPGPHRLEGAVLVDVQGYPVDADGYRLSHTTGERVQKVERAKLDVAFIDGEGRRAYGVLVASIDKVVSRIVERSYDDVLAKTIN